MREIHVSVVYYYQFNMNDQVFQTRVSIYEYQSNNNFNKNFMSTDITFQTVTMSIETFFNRSS